MINGQFFCYYEIIVSEFYCIFISKKNISYVLSDSFLLLLFRYNFIVYIFVNCKIVILYCDLSEKGITVWLFHYF